MAQLGRFLPTCAPMHEPQHFQFWLHFQHLVFTNIGTLYILFAHNQLSAAAGVTFLKSGTACSAGTLFSFNCFIFSSCASKASFSYFAINTSRFTLPCPAGTFQGLPWLNCLLDVSVYSSLLLLLLAQARISRTRGTSTPHGVWYCSPRE